MTQENALIQKYMKIDWDSLCKNELLTEDFIEEYKDNIKWDIIAWHQKLSEELMERHIDKIDFVLISQTQILSENFIEKYKDKVYWPFIFTYQKLSEDFILKYHNYDAFMTDSWYYILSYQKISEDTLINYCEEFDSVAWGSLSRNQNISEDFIRKYFSKLDIIGLIFNNNKIPLSLRKQLAKEIPDKQLKNRYFSEDEIQEFFADRNPELFSKYNPPWDETDYDKDYLYEL